MFAGLDPLEADAPPAGNPTADAFQLDVSLAATRTIRGCALLVCGRTGDLHRLNHIGTEIWEILSAAATPLDCTAIHRFIADRAMTDPADVEAFLGDLEDASLVARVERSLGSSRPRGNQTRLNPRLRAPGPRRRRIASAWEIVDEISPASGVVAHAVGAGFMLCASDGTLSVLASEAAFVWNLLCRTPSTFAETLDALCDRFGISYQAAEDILVPLLQWLSQQGAVCGVEHLAERRVGPGPGATNGHPDVASTIFGARSLGRLERMRPGVNDCTQPTRLLSNGPVVRDLSSPITPELHVAIVCQYGIHGLVPGTGLYVQRCIALLRQLDVDMIVLAGGGRHGRADVREAESVVDLYQAHLPDVPLWMETHSSTTWENLQYSLDLLLARSIAPGKISLLGDRTRAEKLRLCCWLARRRFPRLSNVSFRVVPVARQSMTWRDRRAVQILVGTTQVLKESRRAEQSTILAGPGNTQ